MAPRGARFAIIGRCCEQRALLAHPLQPRLVAEALLIDYRAPVRVNDGREDTARHRRPAAPRGARPGVLSLNIREKAALYAAYMPFLKGGGIFIPTSRPYALGEEVFMLLSLMDDPNRIAVQGKVVWITPEGVQGNRTQGIGVQFTHGRDRRRRAATIERILGETLASTRPTHTM